MLHSGINVLFEGSNFARLMAGLWTSIWIAALSLVIGLAVGTIFGILRTLKNRPIRFVLRLYLEFFRIVPTVVLLYLVYYILPRSLHVNWPATWMAVLAFSMWVAAEFSDIVRGALESVPKTQRESGLALGLNRLQLFRYVLLPQAVKLELPATINLATRVIKTTSLLMIINIMEVINVGQQIIEANNQQYPAGVFWVYGFIFILNEMTEEVLRVEHLNKFYGKHQTLFDINFSLNKGEVLTLLGPSGSGKSTLLRTLNGLEEYEDGAIYFHAKKINPSPKEWQLLRQKIGMVFQSYDLFPNLTVMENILLAPVKVQKRDEDEVKEEAVKLLKQVGLSEYGDAYPRELSGGQKQRVAIVRALVMHPEVMLFDEITASLDPEMVRGVLDIMQRLSDDEHMTMIIVTHEMNFAARIADKVLFLEDGKILEDTPGKEFFAKPKTKRAQEFLESMDF